jgi:hypothetical protein
MTIRTFRIAHRGRAWTPGTYAGISAEGWRLAVVRYADVPGWAVWIGPFYIMVIR